MFATIRKIALAALTPMLSAILISCSGNSTGDDDEVWTDGIEPSIILDLAVVSVTDTSVTLSWTAPGDDSTSGTATRYDLRCSDETITYDNFIDAVEIAYVPAPLVYGTVQTVEVVGLVTNSRYYFSIIAFDENENYSFPSNEASAIPFVNVPIAFPDPALEAVIRSEINKPTGAIMRSDIIDLTEVSMDDAGVTDLSGLQHCVSLVVLQLINSSVSDLTPLSGMPELQGIDLYGNNVSNVAPLAGLSKLSYLNLGGNNITSITPLASLSNLESLRLHENILSDFSPITSLTSLTSLDLHSCQISDIAFLAALTNLQWLQLQVNSISNLAPLSGLPALRGVTLNINGVSDLSPLSGLTNLESLELMVNQIVDVSPLVANAGLGTGDVVRLNNNPLSQSSIDTHIPALQARGVTVYY